MPYLSATHKGIAFRRDTLNTVNQYVPIKATWLVDLSLKGKDPTAVFTDFKANHGPG